MLYVACYMLCGVYVLGPIRTLRPFYQFQWLDVLDSKHRW